MLDEDGAVEEGGRREEWTVDVERAQQVCI